MLAICKSVVYKRHKFLREFSFGDNNEKRYSSGVS